MPSVVHTDTIASGASTSAGINMPDYGWTYLNVQVATMSTAAAIAVQASADSGSTYYNIFDVAPTSTVSYQYIIASGVGTNGGVVYIPPGHKMLRFVATGTVTNGVVFKVICTS